MKLIYVLLSVVGLVSANTIPTNNTITNSPKGIKKEALGFGTPNCDNDLNSIQCINSSGSKVASVGKSVCSRKDCRQCIHNRKEKGSDCRDCAKYLLTNDFRWQSCSELKVDIGSGFTDVHLDGNDWGYPWWWNDCYNNKSTCKP